MTYVGNGIYEKTFAISEVVAEWISAEGATFAYKFAANGAWANPEGTAGIEFGAEEDGVLTPNAFEATRATIEGTAKNIFAGLAPGKEYTFTLDVKDNSVTVLPVITSVAIVGTVNDGDTAWDPSAEVNFMTSLGNGIYEKTVTISAVEAEWISADGANFAFKFAANGAWANPEGTAGIEFGAIEDGVLSANDSIVVKSTIEGTAKNIFVGLTAAGTYKFTLNVNDCAYTIEKQ